MLSRAAACRAHPTAARRTAVCPRPRPLAARAYGHAAHDDHGHGHGHGAAKKSVHPQLSKDDPEWLTDPQDAYYARSISNEHRATNKDLTDAYRHSSVYVKAEQIAKPGVFDELRRADEVLQAKADAAAAAQRKLDEAAAKAAASKGWRSMLKRS